MWTKTIELLNFIGMPPKMAAFILSAFMGFSLALAIIPPFVFVNELSDKVMEMETTVVGKVDELIGLVSHLGDNQQIVIEYTIELSKTEEYSTTQLVEILKELAKEERVKIIIQEKEKSIKQYQKDHLPHNKKEPPPKRTGTIGIRPQTVK